MGANMVNLPVEIIEVEYERITFLFPFCQCFKGINCQCQGITETVKKDLVKLEVQDETSPVLWKTGPAKLKIPGWLVQKMQNKAFHGKPETSEVPENSEWVQERIHSNTP